MNVGEAIIKLRLLLIEMNKTHNYILVSIKNNKKIINSEGPVLII